MAWWERKRDAERPTMPPPIMRTGVVGSEDAIVEGFAFSDKEIL